MRPVAGGDYGRSDLVGELNRGSVQHRRRPDADSGGAAGDVFAGHLQYFPNVSGGTATVTFVYWQNGKPIGHEAQLEVTATALPGNQVTVPEGADMAVMTFGDVTFPAGAVIISLTRS